MDEIKKAVGPPPDWFGPMLGAAQHQDRMNSWPHWQRLLHRLFIARHCPACKGVERRNGQAMTPRLNPPQQEGAMKETYSSNCPLCPFCHYPHRDAWELFPNGYDDLANTECGDCGREYDVSAHMSVSYTSRPKGGFNPRPPQQMEDRKD